MTRKEAEDAREAKLVELRKKYLDSKGIISKARPSAKVKLTGLDKVEAEREAKLVELREKYLAKKRAVTKNDGKLASAVKRSSGVVKTKKGDGKLASAVKRPPMSKRGDGTLASAVKRPPMSKTKKGDGTLASAVKKPPMSKRGDSKIASVVKKPPMAKRGDGKLASAVKRSSGVFKKKTLAPTTSVRPIARTTTTDPKKEKGYFVNKKKGNAMVRVFPNISPALYGRMSAKERKALNLPSPNSTKYTVDFNQRNALTFIIKK